MSGSGGVPRRDTPESEGLDRKTGGIGLEVPIRAWRYEAVGVEEARVQVYFLDTDLPENPEWDRSITQLESFAAWAE